MRLDDAGARTWLLGAVAAWAVLLWLLALAGMGGRIAPLPEDAALVHALPQPAPPAENRVGGFADYDAIGARPLLSETRRPQPFSLQAEGGEAPAQERFDYVLTGVLLTPELEMAILQPAGGGESVRLRVGEAPEDAPSWRLASLSPREAVFAGPGGDQALVLRAYDGSGDVRPAMPMPVPVAGDPMATMDDAAEAPDMMDADEPMPEAQMETIRRRIEARREQLRREARQPAQAGPPPPPTQQM